MEDYKFDGVTYIYDSNEKISSANMPEHTRRYMAEFRKDILETNNIEPIDTFKVGEKEYTYDPNKKFDLNNMDEKMVRYYLKKPKKDSYKTQHGAKLRESKDELMPYLFKGHEIDHLQTVKALDLIDEYNNIAWAEGFRDSDITLPGRYSKEEADTLSAYTYIDNLVKDNELVMYQSQGISGASHPNDEFKRPSYAGLAAHHIPKYEGHEAPDTVFVQNSNDPYARLRTVLHEIGHLQDTKITGVKGVPHTKKHLHGGGSTDNRDAWDMHLDLLLKDYNPKIYLENKEE